MTILYAEELTKLTESREAPVTLLGNEAVVCIYEDDVNSVQRLQIKDARLTV